MTDRLWVTTTFSLPWLLTLSYESLILWIESLIINHLLAFHSMRLIHLNSNWLTIFQCVVEGGGRVLRLVSFKWGWVICILIYSKIRCHKKNPRLLLINVVGCQVAECDSDFSLQGELSYFLSHCLLCNAEVGYHLLVVSLLGVIYVEILWVVICVESLCGVGSVSENLFYRLPSCCT